MDSLIIAFLMGMFAEPGDSVPFDQGQLTSDSITVTISIEVTETIVFKPDLPDAVREIWHPVFKTTHTARQVMTSGFPDQANQFRIAFGLSGVIGEELGYISIVERDGPAGWILRSAIMESWDTAREREIRLALVHGVL